MNLSATMGAPKAKTHSKEYVKRQNRLIDIKAKRMEDRKYKESLEASLLTARKDIAYWKCQWKDIAAEMRTTLKRNKRWAEMLRKTAEMFELADMVQIGRDQEATSCEYCKGITKLNEFFSAL